MALYEFNEEERTFLKESLRYSQMQFEERAARYLYGQEKIEGYRETSYNPKIKMFQDMQSKLNKEKT